MLEVDAEAANRMVSFPPPPYTEVAPATLAAVKLILSAPSAAPPVPVPAVVVPRPSPETMPPAYPATKVMVSARPPPLTVPALAPRAMESVPLPAATTRVDDHQRLLDDVVTVTRLDGHEVGGRGVEDDESAFSPPKIVALLSAPAVSEMESFPDPPPI